MNKLIVILMTLFCTMAQANQVTIDIPAGTQTLIITADEVPVDTCNAHGLSVGQSSSFGDGYYLGIISTKKACFTTAFKYVTLSDELDVEGLETITLHFEATSFPKLQFQYQ